MSLKLRRHRPPCEQSEVWLGVPPEVSCSLAEELSDSGIDEVSLAPKDTVATVTC